MDAKTSSRLLKARKKLGERLEVLIREQGYRSMENFALANGIHKATLHQVLRATADPRLSTLFRLAEALELPLEDLIKGLDSVT